MIVSINSVELTTPLLILRTCMEQNELSMDFDSVLLTRFAKQYNPDDSPNFMKLGIDKIIDRVYVIEDFLELFENKLDCNNLIMDGPTLPVEWYSDSINYNNFWVTW